MNPIFQKELDLFREEFKKAYKDILPDDILEAGNKWFEDFLLASLKRASMAVVEESVGGLYNPYPLSIFPEPWDGWQNDISILAKSRNSTIDCISAHHGRWLREITKEDTLATAREIIGSKEK